MIGYISRTVRVKEILVGIRDIDLLAHYLNIKSVPCLIRSPLRADKKPSFSLFSFDGDRIYWKDFSTGDGGSTLELLSLYFNTDFDGIIAKIAEDRKTFAPVGNVSKSTLKRELGCKVKRSQSVIYPIERQWQEHDWDYWSQFGIDIPTLTRSKVMPISGFYIDKGSGKTYYKANKEAYAYKEDKDGNTTYKIYQPFSKTLKWLSKHDASVISLWTQMPAKGDRIVICSSLKDALCLQCNTGIPAISLQGEGYLISQSAISVLKERFSEVVVLFDNDKAGRKGTKSLTKATGFKAAYPVEEFKAKDIADLFKALKNRQQFKNIILKTLQNGTQNHSDGPKE